MSTMHGLPAEVLRHIILGLTFFLPYPRRKAIDRWWRGREEHHKLHRADWLLISWGKSGRTWLRVMLSRFYQVHFGLEANRLLGFDNLHAMNRGIPKVFFTHGNYLRNYTGHGYDIKADFLGKKIVLLVRDPRDVAVSQYFQWKYRMRPGKKRLNDYPLHGAGIDPRVRDGPRCRLAEGYRLFQRLVELAGSPAGRARHPLRGHASGSGDSLDANPGVHRYPRNRGRDQRGRGLRGL
jgi:hypothetical protein